MRPDDNTIAKQRLRLYFIGLIIFAIVFGYLLTRVWLGDYATSIYVFVGVMALLTIGPLLFSMIAPLRDKQRRSELADHFRRHYLAVLLLALAIGVVVLNTFAMTWQQTTLLALQLGFLASLWLYYSWRYARDPVLQENTRRFVREQRGKVIFAALFGTALLVLWGLWVQPFSSEYAATAFSAPLSVSILLTVALAVSYLKSWPTQQRSTLVYFSYLGLLLAIFAPYVFFTSYSCKRADCGGSLLRSKNPAPWSEQLDAARSALDAGYTLAGVHAKPVDYQPPNSNHRVLEVDFDWMRPNGQVDQVRIQDNAPVWKRAVKSNWMTIVSGGEADLTPTAEQVKISPTEAMLLTLDAAVAGGADVTLEYSPSLMLFSAADAAKSRNLSDNKAPIWIVNYVLKKHEKAPYVLQFLVDATNGAILEQATQ